MTPDCAGSAAASLARAGVSGRAARGFTLLELLVALTVFSLLAATAYAGLRTSSTSWERAEARIADHEERRAVRNFIARQLAQAAPLARIDRRQWTAWFVGENDNITFLTTFPDHLDGGGLFELVLRQETGTGSDAEDGGHRLVAQWRRLDPAARPGRFERGQGRERLLVDGLEDIELRYFGDPDGKSGRSWHERWVGHRRLPSLVEMHVRPRDAPAWPPVVVAVRSDTVRFVRGGDAARVGLDGEEETEEGVPVPGATDGTEGTDGTDGAGGGDGAGIQDILRGLQQQAPVGEEQ